MPGQAYVTLQRCGANRTVESVFRAPDTAIKVHPIKFGSGEFTSVIGVMTGTFTSPCRSETGSSFNPQAWSSAFPCTVGHWKDGVMIEERLFWDNATYMRQIGRGK